MKKQKERNCSFSLDPCPNRGLCENGSCQIQHINKLHFQYFDTYFPVLRYIVYISGLGIRVSFKVKGRFIFLSLTKNRIGVTVKFLHPTDDRELIRFLMQGFNELKTLLCKNKE